MSADGRCDDDSRSPGTRAVPRVAIVDDDDSVRQSTSRLLRSVGYRVDAFASGEDLLLSESVARVECFLLDVRMPTIDGVEVAQRLRLSGARAPVVFITGRASDEEERRARSAGAAGFLRKPVGREALFGVLESVLRRAGPDGGGSDDD